MASPDYHCFGTEVGVVIGECNLVTIHGDEVTEKGKEQETRGEIKGNRLKQEGSSYLEASACVGREQGNLSVKSSSEALREGDTPVLKSETLTAYCPEPIPD